MYKKFYIKDFVKEFNNLGVIFYNTASINLKCLREKLEENCLNKLYLIDEEFKRKAHIEMFYIENCDLQIVRTGDELFRLLNDDYTIEFLYKDKNGFFIKLEVLQ